TARSAALVSGTFSCHGSCEIPNSNCKSTKARSRFTKAELGRADPRCEVWDPQEMRETIMPRGDKSSYTDKQKRQAEHIEEGYEKKGVSKDEAEARAWATVNKESGGGKKSGSGRGKETSTA